MDYPIGAIVRFAEAKCPTCQNAEPFGANTMIGVEKIWDGSMWLLLNSFEAGYLVANLEMKGIESSGRLWNKMREDTKYHTAPSEPA